MIIVDCLAEPLPKEAGRGNKGVYISEDQAEHISSLMGVLAARLTTKFMCDAFDFRKALAAGDLKAAKKALFGSLENLDLYYKFKGRIPVNVYGLCGSFDEFDEQSISFGETSEEMLLFDKKWEGRFDHIYTGKEVIAEARKKYLTDKLSSNENERVIKHDTAQIL